MKTVPNEFIMKAYNDLDFAENKANQELYEKLREIGQSQKYTDKELIGTLQLFLIEVIRASMEQFNQHNLEKSGEDLK